MSIFVGSLLRLRLSASFIGSDQEKELQFNAK
jgi:hypothetical protein